MNRGGSHFSSYFPQFLLQPLLPHPLGSPHLACRCALGKKAAVAAARSRAVSQLHRSQGCKSDPRHSVKPLFACPSELGRWKTQSPFISRQKMPSLSSCTCVGSSSQGCFQIPYLPSWAQYTQVKITFRGLGRA